MKEIFCGGWASVFGERAMVFGGRIFELRQNTRDQMGSARENRLRNSQKPYPPYTLAISAILRFISARICGGARHSHLSPKLSKIP